MFSRHAISQAIYKRYDLEANAVKRCRKIRVILKPIASSLIHTHLLGMTELLCGRLLTCVKFSRWKLFRAACKFFALRMYYLPTDMILLEALDMKNSGESVASATFDSASNFVCVDNGFLLSWKKYERNTYFPWANI